MPFSPYDYLRDELLRRRRQPMDERLPDGSTVQDLLQRVQDPTIPQPSADLMQRTQDPMEPRPDPALMTRPRRVFEQPPSTSTAGRPRYTDPITYDTSGMPERRPNNYGAEPLDTSIKYRDALENWRPSGERSLGNTARGAGYGLLTAAQANPGSPEAMIGGGIAGLIASLVKPSSKNWMRRGLAIPQADAEVARQLKIASEQAKLRQMEVNPYLREVGLNQGQQRIDLNRDRLAQQGRNARMRTLASIFNAYPEFDTKDPKNATILAAMKAAGLPVTDKTRGSLWHLDEREDENGNVFYVRVHKGTGQASVVTGAPEGPSTQQLNREAAQERTEYTQGQINERLERRESEGGGFTPIQRQNRIDKAAELHAEVESWRALAKRAYSALANPDPKKRVVQDRRFGSDPVWAEEALDTALQGAQEAASKLKAGYSDLYEAGEGDQDASGRRWAYSKPRERAIEQQSQPGGRSIEGAIKAFRKKIGREPTADEITTMRKALGQ